MVRLPRREGRRNDVASSPRMGPRLPSFQSDDRREERINDEAKLTRVGDHPGALGLAGGGCRWVTLIRRSLREGWTLLTRAKCGPRAQCDLMPIDQLGYWKFQWEATLFTDATPLRSIFWRSRSVVSRNRSASGIHEDPRSSFPRSSVDPSNQVDDYREATRALHSHWGGAVRTGFAKSSYAIFGKRPRRLQSYSDRAAWLARFPWEAAFHWCHLQRLFEL